MAMTHEPTPRKPLRLLPGVVIVTVQWLLWFVVPVVAPDAALVGMLGGVVGGLAIVVWWLFFSRAPWSERVGAILLMIVAVVATKLLVHQSIAGVGMGMLLYIFSIPYLSLALVAWALVTRRLSDGARRVSLVAAIVLACAPWTLLRTAGVGGADSEFHWRWTPTPEQRLLAQVSDEPKALPPPTPPAETPKEPLAAKTADAPAALPKGATAKTELAGLGGARRAPGESNGRAFVDPSATALFAACGSKRTGRSRLRLRSGAGRSDLAGRPSPCAATWSTRRSSAVRTRSSPVTG